MIMKGLLSGYSINILTIHEARNAKVLCLFENAAYLELLFFEYSIVQYAFPSIDHGSRRTRPRRVSTRYGRPVAQKIATGLLYRRPKVWSYESKGVVFKIVSR